MRLGPPRTFGDSVAFAQITSVREVGDYLLVTDRYSSPHNAVVDVRSGDILGRFGRDGQGPGEFRDASWSLPLTTHSGMAWLYDFKNHRLSLVSLHAPDHGRVVRELALAGTGDLERPIQVGDRIISNGLFANHTLALFDTMGRLVSRIAVTPPFTKGDISHGTGRFMLNRNFLAAHPRKDRIALAYQFDNRLDILTATGSLLRSVRGPVRVTPRFHVKGDRFFWEDGNEMAYADVDASNQYVYALFCGCRLGQEQPSSRVHVFRWDGDYVGEILLDRVVRTINVTPNDTLLYGAVDDPYPQVSQWRLPAVLRSGDPVPSPGKR